jgi:hypothetical protein
MRSCVLDLETYLITPQDQTPRIVCGQVGTSETGRQALYLRHDLPPVLAKILDGSWEVWGHNVSFDLACLIKTWPELSNLIWERLLEGKILDTMIAAKLRANEDGQLQKLDRPGMGSFSLLGCVKREFGDDLSADKGEDSWRLRYSELDGVPLPQWPAEAPRYALADVYWTHRLAQRYGHPADLVNKTAAQFALYLTTVEGITIDSAVVDRLRSEFSDSRVTLEASLIDSQILRTKKVKGVVSWSKHMDEIKRRVRAAWPNGDWPLTKTGLKRLRDAKRDGSLEAWTQDELAAFRVKYTATDGDTCQQSGDQVLLTLDEYKGVEKLLSSYLVKMDKGKDRVLRVHYSVPKATGRTSAWGDIGIHQMPRKYDVRRAIIPKTKERVLVGCDYDSLELRAWAQVCLDLLGESTMAENYQRDPDFDPHSYFAAEMLGLPYAEALVLKKTNPAFKDSRQMAKCPNFGYPGGMGALALVGYARASYGVIISVEQAFALKDMWFRVWAEARPYMDHISRKVMGKQDRGQIEQLRSGRVRGGVTFCAAANGFFQGLAADGALRSVIETQRRCYTDKTSALYGGRMLAFIHDEILVDVPRERGHDAAQELRSVMIQSMGEFIPDVPIRCEPVLMECWIKDAKPLFDNAGRLVPVT